MKVIITGASGFVGKNLIHYLDQNNVESKGFSLRNDSWKGEFDKHADAIIHLAEKHMILLILLLQKNILKSIEI